MPPVLWKNVGEDMPSSEVDPPEHVPGAVSRVKGKVKAVFARFRERSRRRGRTPSRSTHQDQIASFDDVETPSTSTGPHLRPPFNLQRNIQFHSISSGSPGVPPFNCTPPPCPLTGRVPALTLPSHFERQLPLTQAGEQNVRFLKEAKPSSRNAPLFKSSGNQNVRSTCLELQGTPVALPLIGDTKFPLSQTPPPLAQPYLPVQYVHGRTSTQPLPRTESAKPVDRPDDTGDKKDSTFQHEIHPKQEKARSESSLSGKEEFSSNQDNPEEEAVSRLGRSDSVEPYEACQRSKQCQRKEECSSIQDNPEEDSVSLLSRSDSIEPYEACQRPKRCQDSQSVPNFCASFKPRLSALDLEGEAYKSVLWEIKKQNDAFQESWKRLEERLDRLENVLSNVYKRGEPAIKGEEAESWDFSQGFVVNEAESLDLIVDLTNVDDPTVKKKLYTAKGVIEPVVTTNEDDTSTVREWFSKRPNVSVKTESDTKEREQGQDDVEEECPDEDLEEIEVNIQCDTSEQKVQTVSSRKWLSLQDPPKNPRIIELERTLHSARLKALEKDQRSYFRPKSLEACQGVSWKPSRKWSAHSRRPIRGDARDDSERIVKTDVVERRRFRFGGIQVPEEQTKLNHNHIHAKDRAKPMKRSGDGQRKSRGMNFKLPSWLSRRRKKKKVDWEAPEPDEDEEAPVIETLPGPVETTIRVHVNPEKEVHTKNKVEEPVHHINAVDSKLIMGEMWKRISGVDEQVEDSNQDCASMDGQEENKLEYRHPSLKNRVVIREEPSGKDAKDGPEDERSEAVRGKESAKPDRVFWFEGNQRSCPKQGDLVCGQIQDTAGPKCKDPGYILSQFYGENQTRRFRYTINKPTKAGFDRTTLPSALSTKPADERNTSSFSILTGPTATGLDPKTSPITPELKQNEFEDDLEGRRRRKALKTRLIVSRYAKDITPVMLKNPSLKDRPMCPPTTTDRFDSAASILRRRLDASPLRNQALCRSNEVVFSDSVQLNLGPFFKLCNPKDEGQRDNSGKERDIPNCHGERDGNLHLVPRSSGKSITDPNSGLVVSAECDQVQIMLPKLAGKSLERVLVEVRHDEAPEKLMEDGQCVPVLSKELDCEGRPLRIAQKRNKKKRTQGGEIKEEKPFVCNTCSLRRLSSHSLEDLILKGCESADRVLNDRLDEEIASLGVPKEDCRLDPPKDEKFVERLVRRLNRNKSGDSYRCRSRPAAVVSDEHRHWADRFHEDGRQRKLIQPVRTEPSHRFHFRESQGLLSERLRQPCQRLHRRRKHGPVLDADTTFLERPEKDHLCKARSPRRRSRKPAFAGSSTDSETKERFHRKNNGKKPEEISGAIIRSERDGKMVETFMFNPLYAPSSQYGKKNLVSTGIISKLFPSLQAGIKRKSSVRIHSSLKLRTPDGKTYRLDSESLEKTDQRLVGSEGLQFSEYPSAEHRPHSDIPDRPTGACSEISVRKSLKEAVNQNIALNSKKYPSHTSSNDHKELYTVFSEKIYFSNNNADIVNPKPDIGNVHVETIKISYPASGRSKANIGERQFRMARKCKTGALSRQDDSVHDFGLPKRSRRRTKTLLNIANHDVGLQRNVTASEKACREEHRGRVRKRKGMQN